MLPRGLTDARARTTSRCNVFSVGTITADMAADRAGISVSTWRSYVARWSIQLHIKGSSLSWSW